MKTLSLLMIPAALAMVACETMNVPISSTSSFDPLRPPGSGTSSSPSSPAETGPSVTPGEFVSASIPNTPFYKNKPKNNQDADKLLKIGTAMKVISSDSSYVKVELDSGETGYVPSVMLTTSTVATTQEPIPGDNQFPSYPPLPEGSDMEPLPIFDPNGLPPGDAIPTIIDPDAPIPDPSAPITIDPIPDMTEPTPPPVVEDSLKEAEKPAEDTSAADALKSTATSAAKDAAADAVEKATEDAAAAE